MWKKISFVAVLVLLACAASSAALLRGNDVTVVQHVPTQTVVSAEAGTGGAASPCGCCGVATCSCCNKEPAFQRPKIVQSLNASMAPPPCGTCNGACPCETTAPAAATPATSSGMTVVTMNEAMRKSKRCECCGEPTCSCCAQKAVKTQCDCCGTPSCTCCGATLADVATHNDTHHTVEIAHPVAVSHPCECEGKPSCGCGGKSVVAVVQKTPEDHANEKKHDPVVVPCDCKAKDIHPSCGCPGQEGSSEAVSSATGSSAAKGATGAVTVTTTTKCGCCGVETCTCCTEKKEYVKPKMVESLGSKCGCLRPTNLRLR